MRPPDRKYPSARRPRAKPVEGQSVPAGRLPPAANKRAEGRAASPAKNLAPVPKRTRSVPPPLEQRDLACVAELAYDYLMRGFFEVARTLYEGLVHIDPECAHHRLGLGLALDRLGLPREADAEYGAAIALAPQDPIPVINRAEARLALKDGRSARRLLAHALALPCEEPQVIQKARSMLRILDQRETLR